MLLKEIKPGMVVHCKTQEEANILCDTICNTIVEKSKWKGFWVNYRESTCYKISNAGFYSYGRIASYKDSNITEFSDLIIRELTAEETIKLHTELCCGSCEECPLYNVDGYSDCDDLCIENPQKAVEILAQWKSEHEKKEPEIETVDICRIIDIQPDGRKRCVHEEEIKPELPFDVDKEVAEILKRYCMEHDGEFIAVHEVVSRVKK